LQISYSVYLPKIMKIDWQLTKLLQKISGLLFLAHPVYYTSETSYIKRIISDIINGSDTKQ